MVTKIYRFLYRKIITKFFDILMSRENIKLKFFGSSYGGWHVFETEGIKNSTIISCGVGEDISFDIEMINQYKLNVICVDPTPRSIEYFNKIIKNLGSKKEQNYSLDGYQKINSYDLSGIKNNDITLVKYAIWNKTEEELKLYYPENKSNVSLSLSNFSNNYREDTDFVKVNAISYDDLLKKFNLTKLPLIKLDIEGAEYDVLISIIKNNILPDQILVEFDELYTYEFSQLLKYFKLHKKLINKNYISIKTNHFSNQLYIKKECLKKLH
jgi:FkbM family methyltransferase